MTSKRKQYLTLFINTFLISSFTFGGGFVITALLKSKFVDELGWIGEEEMLNLTAIAQSSPGVIAINTSLLLGYSTVGVVGGLIAVVGTALPPLIIITIISYFYTAFRSNVIVSVVMKGMQAGVSAVLANVVLDFAGDLFKTKKIIPVIVTILAFIATYVLGINVIIILLSCAAYGIAVALYRAKKEGALQ